MNELRRTSYLCFVAVAFLAGLVAASPCLAGSVPENPLNSLQMKPGQYKSNQIRSLKAELLIKYSERRAIQQIKRLIAKYRGTALEPELDFRLAELYVRRSKADQFFEMHRDSKNIVRFVPEIVKTANSKRRLEQAIHVYNLIIHKFPNYGRLDLVMFNDAFSYQQIGDNGTAERLYRQLVSDFQNSDLLPDAHLALGEIDFQRQDFTGALKHYLAIKKFPDSTVYPYGIYKAAWAYYNLRDTKSAIHELEAVIKYGVYVEKHHIDARLDLRREALFDLALFYEGARPPSGAYAYLSREAGDLPVGPVIMRLAELYKRHGRDKSVITLLSDFIEERPHSEVVPLAYVYMMNASENLNHYSKVVDLLGRLDKTCDPQSDWAENQKPGSAMDPTNLLAQEFVDSNFNGPKGSSAAPEARLTSPQLCRRAFNKMALGFANKWLKKWNSQPKATKFADDAEKAFALYLRATPNSPQSNRARFVYASTLYKRNQFRQSSRQYAIVGRQTTDKKMGHEARYFALTALQKAVKHIWSDADEAQFKKLANDYLTKDPHGKYVLDVRFEVGFIAYKKHQYSDAERIFKAIGQKYASAEKGRKAQDLYLDILNIKKDYRTLRAYALKLRNECHDKARYAKLNKIYEQTYFLIVQGYVKHGNLQHAVLAYQQFAKLNPNSKLAKKALWNAMQLNYQRGDVEAGAAAAVHYFEKYPNTKEGLDALIKADQSYESMAQIKDAARVSMKLASADPKSKDKWLLLTANFDSLDGNVAESRKIYDSLRKSPVQKTAVEALNALNQLSRNDENPRYHEKVLRDLIRLGVQPEASLAQVHFVEKAYRSGNDKKAFRLAEEVMSEERDGADASALARARLIQARILAKEFKQQSLKSHLSRIQMVLVLKTEKLSKAQIAYQAAERFGDPKVTVEAMSELGDCYLSYSNDLDNMPVPSGLPANEVSVFRDQMLKLSIPMEEKGVDAKLQAFKAAKEFNLGDKLIARLRSELNNLHQPVPANSNKFQFTSPVAVLPLLVKKVGT